MHLLRGKHPWGWILVAVLLITFITVALIRPSLSVGAPFFVGTLLVLAGIVALLLLLTLYVLTHLSCPQCAKFYFLPRLSGAAIGLAFSIFWAFVVIPDLFIQPGYYNLPAWTFAAYAISSIGDAILLSFLYGGLVIGATLYEMGFKVVSYARDLRIGFATFFTFSWAIDMEVSPFFMAPNGTILIPLGTQSAENSAVDGAWASFFMQLGVTNHPIFFGFSPVYLLTYGFVPMLGILVTLFLLAPRQLANGFGLTIRKKHGT